MKKFQSLTLAIAFIFAIGFTSCAQDETMQELIDTVELNKPTANDGDPPPPPPPGGDG